MANFFQNPERRFVHTSYLFKTALEEISGVFVSDWMQVAFEVMDIIEFILSSSVFPVFAIFQK